MKKLFTLALVLVLCLACVASAETVQTISVRIPYIIRMSTLTGSLNNNVILNGTATDPALVAAEDHVNEVRAKDRALYGEEIAAKLDGFKYFACIPAELSEAANGEIKVSLDSPYGFALKTGDPVMMVACIPDAEGAYAYEMIEGASVGANKAEFTIPAETASKLPLGKIILFDFFAK